MAAVLAVYTRPSDPQWPLGCMAETSQHLLRDARAPLPVRPGQPARADAEDERAGVVPVFVCCEPV